MKRMPARWFVPQMSCTSCIYGLFCKMDNANCLCKRQLNVSLVRKYSVLGILLMLMRAMVEKDHSIFRFDLQIPRNALNH